MDIAAEHRARAAQDRAKAAATVLPNVRELHLRAADAWDEMARKVEFTSERAAENKAAKDAAEENGEAPTYRRARSSIPA